MPPCLSSPDLQWALDYFICSWMGQGGRAGTKNEFEGSFSYRRNANGGGSSRRFHSMIGSLVMWRRELARCEFVVQDVFEMIAGVKDQNPDKKHGRLGIYLDPPWYEDGADYKFPFTHQQHRDLSFLLRRYALTRVVVRYGDHPVIRELYPAEKWNVIERVSRTQANKDKRELLIMNGPSAGKK